MVQENQNTWCVYKHTSPSGKTYIGITHYSNPKLRWGKDGSYYSKKTVFYKAIQKYGWNNIQHEILLENQSESAAKYSEIYLIKWYKLHNLSYNMTIGGDGYNFGCNSNTTEYRTEMSRRYRAAHPDYDKIQMERHREKIRERRKEYYKKHREEILLSKKRPEVLEKARIRAAKWRQEHPNYMKEYMKEYNTKLKNG